MERSEPTLVPEWLKNSGSSTTGSSTTHSDDHPARAVKNKSSVNSNIHDFGRSSSSERTTSSYFRRSSSSNSSGNFKPYNSFGRNQRDWEKDTYDSRDQENSVLGGRRHRNFSDPLGDTLGKFERDGLRRSQSMISGKRGDAWPKKVSADSGKVSNGLLTKGSIVAGVSKASFERDFPSLGVDERAGVETTRVPSPGLNTAIQILPINTSTSLGGEKWTSALAEVPMLVGSNGTASSSVTSSAALSSTTSLNMAEAVAQGPTRAQTTPQLSIGAHRLEELAIKQSRQLIPKTLVLNSSDKQKNKVVSQQCLNQSPRVKGDVLKASNVGKLHVLKPVREKNGVVKEKLSPTSGGSRSGSGSGSPNNGNKQQAAAASTLVEKRPTSQARSRNDFFNLVRKKSLSNPGATENASSKDGEMAARCESVEVSVNVEEKGGSSCCNGDGRKHPSMISEEEEAAFLRSMGWEENGGDDDEEGLTQEEITAFYRDLTKYMNSKPSSRILHQLVQHSQLGGIDEISDDKHQP